MLGPLRTLVNKATVATAKPPAPFYVVSHERSGTHFLINTLQKNSVLFSEVHTVGAWIGPYVAGQRGQFSHIDRLRDNWLKITADVSIIKTHSDRALFTARYPKAKVVYVLRDPRDTLVSFYYYLRHPMHSRESHLGELGYSSVSEFLRHPLTSYLRWSSSLLGEGKNVVERWAYHVRGWLAAEDTLVVRYEELKTDFRAVLGRLAPFLGLTTVRILSPVGLHERSSILPRKGVIGDWRSHFTPGDETFLRDAIEGVGLDWEAVIWR